MILTRTPYNAAKRVQRTDSPSLLASLSQGDEVFVRAGYIRVFQDIRGKYGSEGAYVMTRPPRGPLNPTATDDTTDAWDTVDWLSRHVPESNGRVGMLGSSYEGWTVVMALLDPHPMLKVATPESPMVDGWKGDDWFHNGAFRADEPRLHLRPDDQERGEGKIPSPRETYDDFTRVPARRFGRVRTRRAMGMQGNSAGCRGLSRSIRAYDSLLAGSGARHRARQAAACTVPTHDRSQGLWDQEDMYGGFHSMDAAMKAQALPSQQLPGHGPLAAQRRQL